MGLRLQISCPPELVYTTFLRNCGRGESLPRLSTVVRGRQGHVVLFCEILLLQQSFVS